LLFKQKLLKRPRKKRKDWRNSKEEIEREEKPLKREERRVVPSTQNSNETPQISLLTLLTTINSYEN